MHQLALGRAIAARLAAAFAADRLGAAVIEYALLLAALSMTALAAYDYLGGGMTDFYGSVGASLDTLPD